MPRITDTTQCHCGHVLDEHEDGKECTVEGCGCIHFAADHDAKEE